MSSTVVNPVKRPGFQRNRARHPDLVSSKQVEKPMIKLVQGLECNSQPRLTNAMYRMRAETFSERLGWDVKVKDGMEIDEFDAINPLYLLAVDSHDNLKGSLRLLPTTGKNMLQDVFSELLDNGETVRSPLIWESTRFCVSKSAALERTPNKLNRTTGELLAGIVEVGMLAGLQSVVSVYDARMKRVLQTAGCPATQIGTPKKIGKVTTYAGLFAIDVAMLERIRCASGIRGSVLEDGVEDLLAA